MIESCAAAAVLGAALVVVVTLLTSLGRQRQGASRHAQAVIVAENLLERLTAAPYEALTPEAESVRRASNVAEFLPDGEAKIRLSDVAGTPAGKRIEVEVSWRPAGGGPPSRHQVATWVYEGAYRVKETK
jgi:hypothetical protein